MSDISLFVDSQEKLNEMKFGFDALCILHCLYEVGRAESVKNHYCR